MELKGRDARRLVHDVIAEIKYETGYDVSTDLGKIGQMKRAFCMNTPGIKKIGLDLTWFDDDTVLDERAVGSIFTALFHEVQHARRYNELETGVGDTLIMALTIVDNINRSYYLANYANNLRELDAELHAMDDAHSVLERHFSIEDADRMILSVAKAAKQSSATKEHSLYHGLSISPDDDFPTLLERYKFRMNAILRGDVFATQWRYSEADPAFKFIQSNVSARRLFCRIKDTEFALMTEFLASISIITDVDIKHEFPANRYLKRLSPKTMYGRTTSRIAVKDFVFETELPEWYKSVVGKSERCVETALQMFDAKAK